MPLALQSKDEVEMFLDGKLPKMAKTATDIAVVGMFGDEKVNGNLLFCRVTNWVRYYGINLKATE